ncbi:ABC transporter permease [Maritimibacter dapengensis]|uniref:FtsX-like permease family protein n=1 Tax=Maritimibacter dapengensis TaxID=2836868 RepID=A0ABS6SXJ8_9RHOB|nr:FtsX-like permease family protein [Maritimibacter dapengensis]MBV7377693.1 FtsX-like permease family protein [Maritimibacter dapengensis]
MSDIAVAARIARRELRGGVKGFRVFLACLALGVAAIAAVGSVREAIQAGISDQGAVLLGGDASVELTYRRADPADVEYLRTVADEVGEVIDFRSMARVPGTDDQGLTQVKAVDGAWPLYGAPELDPDIDIAAALAPDGDIPGAVMAPLLAERLQLEIGDSFTLGTQEFRLAARLVSAPDDAAGGFDFGPPTIVHIDDLATSGLINEGTLFNSEYRLRTAPGTDLDALRQQVMARMEGSAPRWRDARNGAPGISEFVDRLASFLVLVGLAGLAVGGVGISAAVRAYLDEKTEVIATLKTLGAGRSVIFLTYALQIGMLTVVGIALGLIIGGLIPVVFGPLISAALPIPARLTFSPEPMAEAALYGALAAAIFTLWPLAKTEEVRAAALFRGRGAPEGYPRPVYILITALGLALLIGAAALFSDMARIALWSAFGIFFAFLLLVLAGRAVRALSRGLAKRPFLRGRPMLRMAFASVGGPGNEASSVVLSLGLGLSVLAAVGQVDNNLRGSIARELPDIAPSFFVVDIQPDQIDAVRDRVTTDTGVSRMDAAPMLRGMITEINGRPARDVAGDHWVVEGDRGVTYSEEMPDRSRLTAGEWWPADYDGEPLISFVAEEAGEIGLSVGDTMTVNILGRDITARVASLRDVNFSSAGMNFTIAMNPSALAGAPHSWLATIYAEEEAEAALLRDISRTYPNITMISVRDAIGRATELLGTIAAAITYGALITLVTGAVVLIGAALAGERARTYEAAVLKTLGAPRARILANFALRSVILGAAAGVVAVFAGGMAGWAVSTFVMDTGFVFEPVSAIAIVTGGVVVTLLTGLAFAWRPLSARPAQVLRARE